MTSHYNVIINIVQLSLYEAAGREQRKAGAYFLPINHVHGPVFMTQTAILQGSEVVILRKWYFKSLFRSD